MSKMVRVECGIPNGITLQLWKKGFDDGTGFQPMTKDGPAVILNGPSALDAGVGNTDGGETNFATTEVDAEFWAAWQAQNEKNPMLEIGQVREVKEPEAEEVDSPDPKSTE